MPENNQPNKSQQGQNPGNQGQNPQSGQQNDPNNPEKQAPGYNEGQGRGGQGKGGDVNQQDPAWRPGDAPSSQTDKGDGTTNEESGHPQSQGQRAGS